VNKLYYILIVILFLGCNDSNTIELTVRKDRVVFHNWHPTQIDNNSIGIYVWNTDENKPNTIPIAGQFKYGTNNTFEFVPNFPFMENTQYVLVRSTKKEKIQQHFSLPKKNNVPLTIEAIYPTSDSLPENLLRMYVVFSHPMKTTGNIENIKLINNKGKEIEGAIFNNVYELWDDSQKQLTVIFDPSRVKTDLIANKELGRALEPNQQFQLQIDTVEDIYGQKLQQPFIKTFRVIPQDTIAPNTKNWQLITSKHNSKQPLQLVFKTPLDRMSLLTRIKVVDEFKQEVKGKISISNKEMKWQFTPNDVWEKEKYSLLINSRLEDPSGNNLNGLFDHKTGSLKNEQEGKIIALPFKI